MCRSQNHTGRIPGRASRPSGDVPLRSPQVVDADGGFPQACPQLCSRRYLPFTSASPLPARPPAPLVGFAGIPAMSSLYPGNFARGAPISRVESHRASHSRCQRQVGRTRLVPGPCEGSGLVWAGTPWQGRLVRVGRVEAGTAVPGQAGATVVVDGLRRSRLVDRPPPAPAAVATWTAANQRAAPGHGDRRPG